MNPLTMLDHLTTIRNASNAAMKENTGIPDTDRVFIHKRLSEIRRLNAEVTDRISEIKQDELMKQLRSSEIL